MEVVASLSQGRTAAAQCGLFTHKSVPVIFDHLYDICGAVQIIKLLIKLSFPLPSHLVHLWPEYLPQHPILIHAQSVFLPPCERSSATWSLTEQLTVYSYPI